MTAWGAVAVVTLAAIALAALVRAFFLAGRPAVAFSRAVTYGPPSTPLLDGREALPEPGGRRGNPTLAFASFAAWAALGWSGALWAVLPLDGPSALALVTGYYASVAVHELGHVLAGLSLGWAFESVTVGLFEFGTAGGRPRLGLSVRRPLGGLTRFVPPAERSRPAMVRFASGGIAANAVTAIACAVLAVAYAQSSGLWERVATDVACVSSYLAFTSLAPFAAGFLPNDGMQIADAASPGPRSLRFEALRALNDAAKGGSLAETPLDVVEDVLACRDGSRIDVIASMMGFLAVDQRDAVLASACLENALAGSASSTAAERDECYLFAGIFCSSRRRDVAAARRFAERAGTRGSRTNRYTLEILIAWDAGAEERAAAFERIEAEIAALPEGEERADCERAVRALRGNESA